VSYSYVKETGCICIQCGLDGTTGHTEIVATVVLNREVNPNFSPVPFLSCANHLHLYKRNGFIVREFNENPRQSTFELGESR
jgi:hypothetical protein